MCGIAGVINFNGKALNRAMLTRLSESLLHRGPDGDGSYEYDNADLKLALLHRRLKILDLSERARQPITNEQANIWLTFNGEIYNFIELRETLRQLGHQFKSDCDSEVVVHAWEQWKEHCLERFNGMWAFALWDEKEQTLFCARDRVGVKPFYYYFKPNDCFIFASELKAFLNIGRSFALNYNALYCFTALRYYLNDETWLKDVYRLQPGKYLMFKKDHFSIKTYWDAAEFAKNKDEQNDGMLITKLRAVLEDAVRLRLRSDEPIGAYLSGGIDSSAVVALMVQQGYRSIPVFSGIFDAGIEYDETGFIDVMVEKFSLDSRRVLINSKNFFNIMENLAWHLDEPIAGPGAYSQYCVCQMIKNEGYKVIMGGQGGDELFAGYGTYLSALLPILGSLRSRKNEKLRTDLGNYLNSFKLQSGVYAMTLRHWLKRFLKIKQRRLSCKLSPEIVSGVDCRLREQIDELPYQTEAMLLWDLQYYLPALLQVEDRVGMAFSIETRLPLLDYRVVELALSTPLYLKLNKYASKYILREAVKDLLPVEIYRRRDKKGFSTPFEQWLKIPKIDNALREDLNPFLKSLFKDLRNLSWEKALIGLWLKRTGIR